jgi:hypothetical protein
MCTLWALFFVLLIGSSYIQKNGNRNKFYKNVVDKKIYCMCLFTGNADPVHLRVEISADTYNWTEQPVHFLSRLEGIQVI